ncbi:hypothetical protein HRbin10_01743 [bacterium HR10]|nr:hypothetical protein HRbin10_01743 [bacterium HR10]
MVTTAEEIYERIIKPLPVAERLRLLAMIAGDLAAPSPESSQRPKRNILDLHGLGADLWQGIDAQEYVTELRREWDHRSP